MGKKVDLVWKAKFEKFLLEVPFEDRMTNRLAWKNRYEEDVRMYYGIGCEAVSADTIGRRYGVTDNRTRQILNKAKRIVERYYTAKATQIRRARLAEEIRKVREVDDHNAFIDDLIESL